MFLDKRIRMWYKRISFLLLLNIWLSVQAQVPIDSIGADTFAMVEVEEKMNLFDYLVRDSIREVELTMNFDTLEFYKIKETYQKAILSFATANGSMDTLKVRLHTRGKMRKRVCLYPSLKLKFKKKGLRALGLSEENKYKLVCQCKDGQDAEQLLLKEYLAYKFYNLISDDSYQVHLFKIKYNDTASGESKSRYAFMLETEDAMAKRRGGRSLERSDFVKENISRKRIVQMSIFQYMIGNTDWSISYFHNVKLVSSPDGKMINPIPYDFDYSGLVNAPYAIPNPDLGDLEYVTDRWFMASGCSESEILVHLKQFREKKEAITNAWESFDLLNKRSRKHIEKFMNSFFKTIDNPNKIKRVFIRTSKG